MKLSLLTLVFIGTFLLSSSIAQGQAGSIGGLELSASSNNPVPGQGVTITARSYSFDINSARIVWTVNGKVTKDAVGANTLELVAPPLGQHLSVDVLATLPEGRSIKSSVSIGSGSIDLIVESDGYVPPLYRGKSPPVHQNILKIIAIAHMAGATGAEYDPKTLVYQWKKNDRVIEDQSGYGKQILTLPGDIVPRPYTISVSAWPRDNSARAQALADISSGSPTIVFYVNDPLYGPLVHRAISSLVRIGSQKETTILAVPFGFNKPGSGTGDLSWSWVVNNTKRDELSSNESVVLRAPSNTAGTSRIRLDLRGTDNMLQGATSGFSAAFSSASQEQDEEAVF